VDAGLYHAQAIRWIEEYGVIPGLGNLHGRLAFNSGWFLPTALFGFSFLKMQPFHVLNPLVLVFVIMMSFDGANELLKGHNSFSNVLKISILIPFLFIFKDQLSSSNTDMPAALLICVIFIYFLEIMEYHEEGKTNIGLAISIILSTLAITIKLSTIPMAIFIFYIIVKKLIAGEIREPIFLIGMGLIILAPWIIRNIILSGYLIYPVPSLDIFNFDWKVPMQSVLQEKQGIENYARNPGLIADAVLDRGCINWFPSWLKYLVTSYKKKLEMIALPDVIIIVSIVITLFKVKTLKFNYDLLKRNIIILLTALMGCLFWFATAPDLRLGYGFLILTSILIFLPVMNIYRPVVTRTIVGLTCLAVLYLEVAYVGGDIATWKDRVFWPAAYPKASLTEIRVADRVVYTPGGKGLCWYAPLPCAPGPVSGLEFRGASLQDGFRSKK
jgi:hypothetical protein